MARLARKKRRSNGAAMAGAARICLGIVTGVRGLQGEVRFRSYTDPPENAAAYGSVTDESGMQQFDVCITDSSRNGLILKLGGINDRTTAEALKGTELFAARDVLPELGNDEFYHVDLEGLPVVLADGTAMGSVRGLGDYGAGSVLEITLSHGKPLVLPFTRAAVPVIDLGASRVVIDPPPGLLAEGDERDDGGDGQ